MTAFLRSGSIRVTSPARALSINRGRPKRWRLWFNDGLCIRLRPLRIGSASSHVRRDRDAPVLSGPGDDRGFFRFAMRVEQDVVEARAS